MMVQWRGFLGRLVGQLIKAGLSLIENVFKPFGESFIVSLGLTVAPSEEDTEIP